MNCLATIGVSLATGLIALVPSGFVADWCTRWFEVSEREGGRGYAVVFLAILGFICGCILGLVVARMVAVSSQPSGWRALGYSLLAAFGILALITGFSYAVTEHAPEIDGHSLSLAFELRQPAGGAKPSLDELRKVQFSLYAGNRQSYRYYWPQEEHLRQVGDRWVQSGRLHIHSRTPGRILRLSTEKGESVQEIPIPYAGWPTRAEEKWSEWIAVPLAKGELRYRLRIEVPEPYVAPPDPEAAKFAALSELSPLPEWLPYLIKPGLERQEKALAMVTARTPELGQCILEGPPEISQLALRGAGMIKDPPELLVAPVREIGRRMRADLERFVASKPENDPSYEAAGAIEATFGGWYLAVVSLHRAKRLDGPAEFAPILELARKRPDSQAMSGVVRVTTHFLEEWKSGQK